MSDHVAFPKQRYRDLAGQAKVLKMKIESKEKEAEVLAGKLSGMREKLERTESTIGERIDRAVSDKQVAKTELDSVLAEMTELEAKKSDL